MGLRQSGQFPGLFTLIMGTVYKKQDLDFIKTGFDMPTWDVLFKNLIRYDEDSLWRGAHEN
jgi:hypothetical protein